MAHEEGKDSSLIAAVIADDVEQVQTLLEGGALANCCEDSAELRPLHFAALYDSPKVVPLLVMAGADITALTDCDDTALSIADRHDHKLVVASLNQFSSGASDGRH